MGARRSSGDNTGCHQGWEQWLGLGLMDTGESTRQDKATDHEKCAGT